MKLLGKVYLFTCNCYTKPTVYFIRVTNISYKNFFKLPTIVITSYDDPNEGDDGTWCYYQVAKGG